MPPPVARVDAEPRDGVSEHNILGVQCNLALTYQSLGRNEEALRMQQLVYSGRLKLNGEEHLETLREAHNYANMLVDLERFEEAKSLLCKSMPAARRVLGEGNLITLWFMSTYAESLYKDNGATLDDLRKAVATLVDVERTARRVLGGAHPLVIHIEDDLRHARAVLCARETPSPG